MYKKVYIKAGWQPSDKFSPDSLIHSTTFRRKNPRIPETRVPSPTLTIEKVARERTSPPCKCANPSPSRNSNHLHKRWFLAARQPRVITLWKCAKDGGKEKKKEQAENCMETNGRKMIDERRAKGWTRNPQETIGFTIWTVQCFNTDLDLHRGRKRREKKSGNYKSAFCI